VLALLLLGEAMATGGLARPALLQARLGKPLRGTYVQRRCVLAASTAAGEAIARGKERFKSGDMMGALKEWDAGLAQSPDEEQRRELHFSSACVHAAFGDVELAKMSVRDAINAGLVWDEAVRREGYLELQASTQVKIQLRNFADQVARGARRAREAEAAGPLTPAATPAPPRPRVSARTSVEELVGAKMADGMDVSVGGVVRRVAFLLAALIGLGVALYFAGLQTLV